MYGKGGVRGEGRHAWGPAWRGGGMLCVAGDMHGRLVSQFRRLKE